MNPVYRRTHFLLSAPDLAALPPDIDREVAFAGRSNAGKSSAINAITDQKGLARVSKTPGRTQQINVFPVTPGRVLIDLPGYGYAQVPAAVKARWQRVLPAYLRQRSALRGLMLIMDVRHPMTEFDRQMLDWCAHTELPVHVLLTKADKLRRGPALATLQRVRTALERGWPGHSVQLFSALRRSGIDEAHARLDQWLGLGGSDT